MAEDERVNEHYGYKSRQSSREAMLAVYKAMIRITT